MRKGTKRKSLNQHDIMVLIDILTELEKMDYYILNKYICSYSLNEMPRIEKELNHWYKTQVLGLTYDEETGLYYGGSYDFN